MTGGPVTPLSPLRSPGPTPGPAQAPPPDPSEGRAPRYLIWTVVAVWMLFWTMFANYYHLSSLTSKRNGLRRAEGVTVAELFEHIPEASRRIPGAATNASYSSEWYGGARRRGSATIAYDVSAQEFRSEVAASRDLKPVEAPMDFPALGVTVSRGWYYTKDYPGYRDLEVYDAERLRVHQHWLRR